MTASSPLLRLYAHSVAPELVVQGGVVAITTDMQDALLDAHNKANLDRALTVSFVVDTTTRTCDMRDLILSLSFGSEDESTGAAIEIASRLAAAMDNRSKPCLLVTSVRGQLKGDSRHAAIWTFPKAETFQLSTEAARVDLLDNVFSRSSSLRKAAAFEGRKTKTQFLTGRVLDSQANASDRFVADYWIDRFLGAQLQMSSEEGTRFLATTLRAANEQLRDNAASQEQLQAAIVAVRQDTRSRWSLADFARRFLKGDAAATFLANAPNGDSVNALFDFDRDRFDQLVQFRVYRLDTGVIVSAPFVEIGESVTLQTVNDDRILNLSGRVLDEKIRSRGR